MHRVLALSLVALATCRPALAAAAPRDAKAIAKIDEAINKHYIATKFDQAEAQLLGVIAACKGQCSASVLAKAWMYVGVVRGGGKNNQKGAREAFTNAVASDPKVKLDDVIATPQTKKTFAAARRAMRGATTTGGVEPTTTADPPTESGTDAMDCSPRLEEVQTRRPIPVWCKADQRLKLELRYKSGGGDWKRASMKLREGVYRATIPCDAVQKKGTLRFYVRAKDENGDPAPGFAKKGTPVKIRIVGATDEEPPTFPDKDPPKRCSRSDADEAASCESTDDCETGQSCEDGECLAKQQKKKKRGVARRSWFGLHYAHDFALTGGSEVCSSESRQNSGFACFYKDSSSQYDFRPHPSYSNDIKGGLAPATFRALISFDQLVGENFSAGVRLGYAFGGGPPSGKTQEVKFMPFHLEARASYWFGDAPFATWDVRPYVGLGGGLAQVDAKLPVTVGDCGGTPGGSPSTPKDKFPRDTAYYLDCREGKTAPIPLELDVYKKLGKGFVGLHGGVLFAVTKESGLKLELSVMQMLPTSGQVLEPSLGYVFGL